MSDHEDRSAVGTVDGGPVRLANLLEVVGTETLHVVVAPAGLDVVVGEPVIHDPTEPVPHSPGGVLLGVGLAPGPDGAEAIRRAASAGCSALVFKPQGYGDIGELVDAADATGVTLLACADTVSWRQVDALVSAATAVPHRGPGAGTYSSVGLGDLFALANVIATRVGGAVTIEDPTGQVLAYSNLPHHEIDEVRKLAILGLRTPERPSNRDEYLRIARSKGPVRFEDFGPTHTDRLAIAVRAGSQLLGVIFVLDGSPPLPADAPQRLVEAAETTALHLVRARSHRDPERRQRSDALRAVLDGELPAEVLASQLRIPTSTPTIVMAIQLADRRDGGLAGAQVVDLVGLHCAAWHPQALCTVGDGVVYAMVPLRSPGDTARIRGYGQEVATTLRAAAQLNVKVGLGTVATSLEEVAGSRRMADRVLAALQAGRDADVANVPDVQARIVLDELTDHRAMRGEFLLEGVRLLVEHDDEHRSDYGRSVVAYLDARCEVGPAARRLGVHQNTLRYRLRRVRDLFDLDLDDPEVRQVTWLQLRSLARESGLALPSEDRELVEHRRRQP